MKYVLALMFAFSSIAEASSIAHVRLFQVDWKKAHNQDGDVQVCDDNYFGSAEILLPVGSKEAKVVIAAFQEQCDMKIAKIQWLSDGQLRITTTDAWDCSISFKDPSGKTSHEFTIDLSDAC